MKSFRAIVSEVAQPRGPEEKKFKDMHSYETKSHPVAPDAVFTGAIGADDLPKVKAKRKADQEGDVNYDKQFKESYGSTMVCKDCGDEFGKPTPGNGCTNDCNDKNENCWMPKEQYLAAQTTKEEAEINELDKKTLGSYIKKAHDNHELQRQLGQFHRDNAMAAGRGKEAEREADLMHKHKKKAVNRSMGINTAANKLTKEELELEVNEDLTMVSRQPHPKGGHIVTLIDKNGKKVVRHLNNGKVKDIKNVKDMKSEETQLDELSPETKKSYSKKADASIAKAVDTMKGRASRGWAVDKDSNYKTIQKRMQGKALLTRDRVNNQNEETQLDELDKKTLGSYIKKAGPDAVKQTAQAKRHADAGDMSDKDADMYKNYAKSQRAMDKAKNRQKGISKAVDKLTKEATADPDTVRMMKDNPHMIGQKGPGGLKSLDKNAQKKVKQALGKDAMKKESVEPDLDEALDKWAGADKRKSYYTSIKHAYKPKHTNSGNDSYDPKKVETQAHLQHAQNFHDKETDKGYDRYHTTHKTVPHHEAQVGHLHKAMKANAKGDAAGLKKHMTAYHHGNENHKINKTATYTHAHHLPHHGESKDVKEEVNETTMSAVKKPVNVTGPDGRTRTVMKTTKNKRTDDFGQDVIKAEDKAEVNAMVKAALGGKTKMKESVLNMFASKLKGDSE